MFSKNSFNSIALPTTSKGADLISVWKVGASADTSHLNLPAIAGVACCSTTRLAPDLDIYKDLKNINLWIYIYI